MFPNLPKGIIRFRLRQFFGLSIYLSFLTQLKNRSENSATSWERALAKIQRKLALSAKSPIQPMLHEPRTGALRNTADNATRDDGLKESLNQAQNHRFAPSAESCFNSCAYEELVDHKLINLKTATPHSRIGADVSTGPKN